ncbi:MAG: hypothetical protein JO165_02720 [Candidatus Eremiobacteraeota bacterium]|nr:hypothetical protein [Candidatus Eremiobacteraeota bacterium]
MLTAVDAVLFTALTGAEFTGALFGGAGAPGTDAAGAPSEGIDWCAVAGTETIGPFGPTRSGAEARVAAVVALAGMDAAFGSACTFNGSNPVVTISAIALRIGARMS